LTTFVAAIGSTTRARIQSANVTIVEDAGEANCETLDSLRERIKCRIQERDEGEVYAAGTYDETVTPEACRDIKEPERCRLLYNKITSCYEREGKAKSFCLRATTGVTAAILAGENRNETVVRDYLVALLYDLQGKAEEAQESGTITEDEAAEVIEQIVNIKKAILDGAGRLEECIFIMKSSTAITLVVIIALVVAGIFLFTTGDQEETPEEAKDITQEDIEEQVGELDNLDTSDEVFNSIDDALQILE